MWYGEFHVFVVIENQGCVIVIGIFMVQTIIIAVLMLNNAFCSIHDLFFKYMSDFICFILYVFFVALGLCFGFSALLFLFSALCYVVWGGRLVFKSVKGGIVVYSGACFSKLMVFCFLGGNLACERWLMA